MSDYIKRSDAIIILRTLNGERIRITGRPSKKISDAITRVKHLPAADVVEVVRCKDCIWHDHEDEESGMVYCSEMVGGWVKRNFYCADGERRSE